MEGTMKQRVEAETEVLEEGEQWSTSMEGAMKQWVEAKTEVLEEGEQWSTSMEGAMKQWVEAETEVLEEGLRQRQARLQTSISIAKDDDKDGGLDLSPPKMTSGEVELDAPAENSGTQMNDEINIQQEDIVKKFFLPDVKPISEGSNSSNVISEGEKVSLVKEIEQEVRELILERLYQKPETHAFYCPNCKACIQKVLIQNQELENTSAPAQQTQQGDSFRCSSCFSFLIPIGSWLFPGLVPKGEAPIDEVPASSNVPKQVLRDQTTKNGPENKPPEADQSVRFNLSVARDPLELAVNTVVDSGKQVLKDKQVITDEENKVGTVVESKITGGEDGTRKKYSVANWAAISGAFLITKPKKTDEEAPSNKYSGPDWAAIPDASVTTEPQETEIGYSENVKRQLEEVVIDRGYTGPDEEALPGSTADVDTTVPEVIQEPESSKSWEILKSIVYGGLAESIASLAVVTSAASADATTLNIVALALANLVGGLFILFHNLWELKSEQPRTANYSETNAAKNRYYELGKKDHFFLHATFAVLSFIIFGLVPPLVYGFSFYESGETDFKLAAVAGASLLCITLLAIAKAYIQRPTGYLTYLRTILFYVSTGALASIVSYLAGDLIKKLIEKLGWFESSSDFELLLPEMSIEKHPWGSY